MSRSGLASIALACVGACAGQIPHTENGAPIATLVLRPASWNPNHVPIANVRAVVDDGNVIAVFADDGAHVLSSGALVATDASLTASSATGVVSGPDGTARWIVVLDGAGHVRYLHNLAAFEDVSMRYGLARERVRRVVSVGEGVVAFLLDHEVAVATDHRVTRYATEPLTDLLGGDGVVVGIAKDALVVIRTANASVVNYTLPGVRHAAVGKDGHIYASTLRALYSGDGRGPLSLVYVARGDVLHGLVASGEHVWFADGGELGVIDGGAVAETQGANVAVDAALSSSGSGDVWLLEGGALRRFQSVGTSVVAPTEWKTAVAPVFARACAQCHGYGGVGGLDLATEHAWNENREKIVARVVRSRTMPPHGHVLSEEDRAAIEAWGAPP